MRQQGFDVPPQWEEHLASIVRDVNPGDKLTGKRDGSLLEMYHNNETLVGKVNDPVFTDAFFSIWLGEKTSHKQLRKQLLGLDKA